MIGLCRLDSNQTLVYPIEAIINDGEEYLLRVPRTLKERIEKLDGKVEIKTTKTVVLKPFSGMKVTRIA